MRPGREVAPSRPYGQQSARRPRSLLGRGCAGPVPAPGRARASPSDPGVTRTRIAPAFSSGMPTLVVRAVRAGRPSAVVRSPLTVAGASLAPCVEPCHRLFDVQAGSTGLAAGEDGRPARFSDGDPSNIPYDVAPAEGCGFCVVGARSRSDRCAGLAGARHVRLSGGEHRTSLCRGERPKGWCRGRRLRCGAPGRAGSKPGAVHRRFRPGLGRSPSGAAPRHRPQAPRPRAEA